MPAYQVTFARSARKELEHLSRGQAEKILEKIESLSKNPRPRGCIKLKGPLPLWRVRKGDYRIVYEIDDEKRVVDISVIRHRSEAYR